MTDPHAPFDLSRLTAAQREAAEALGGLRWNAVGVIVEATARYVEHLAASEPEIRLASGDEAAEEIAAQLRREAASGSQALRHFGLIDARLDFAGPEAGQRYESLTDSALARHGDEVLVDGVWIRWVGGEAADHPAWQKLRRRPWRRVKHADSR